VRAWPTIPSNRLILAVTAANSGKASVVTFCQVTVFRNLWTERPPV
jgi:hypothetical protein